MHMHQPHLATRTVYVVGWRSRSTGGFDWYRTGPAADDAFRGEKSNCLDFAGEQWEAFRFDVKVPLRLSDAAVTDLIDADLDDFLNSAPIRFDSAKAFDAARAGNHRLKNTVGVVGRQCNVKGWQ